MQNLIDIGIYILKGSVITFELFFVTIILSIPVGFIFSLGKISKFKILRVILSAYTWFFRGTPLLLQLFFTYFGLPAIGIKFSPFTAAAITFVLNYAAYFTEIFRAGLNSIDKGQYEAANVLGMNYFQTMVRIIIPQTFKRVIPPVCNEGISLVKDTALVSVIGMAEILRNAKEIVTREFIITPFIVAAVVYLLATTILVSLFNHLENKYLSYE
ncbi:inner membrane amino-acid ABC transporter permease protein YecS [Clostridium tepidiprofundi DSM 19306]|uniref:Inner membrane amino-acid ABC transporter permease protein YecS n=1 Tax=Clostridium tepidiprofundi DSM 19306 TaxID=1121338 RepID=A0A151B2W6_9CLOT|nr:amino acid ABC transporter permease [Clostridium tepidiprofundi]KYH34279.1 inner membrane amino-acid ABC transporter permease protein YecS [Clostridium tepidiprofundi DSM 19306]